MGMVAVGVIVGIGADISYSGGSGTITPPARLVGADSTVDLESVKVAAVDLFGQPGVFVSGEGTYEALEALSGVPSFAATQLNQFQAIWITWEPGDQDPAGLDLYINDAFVGTAANTVQYDEGVMFIHVPFILTDDNIGKTVYADVPSPIPLVDNFTPALDSTIQVNQTIGFDVTVPDGTPLASCTVAVVLAGLSVSEAIYDGEAFESGYAEQSNVTTITNGLRFVLKRRGGWPAAPYVKVRAVSEDGEVSL